MAKQTGCYVCEMTFALPEEFRRFTELGLRIQSGGEEGSRARAERERASHEVGKQKERSGQVDGGNKKKTWHQMEGHEAQTPPGNWTNQLSSTLKKVRKSTERACTLFHHGMREFQANRLKKKKKKVCLTLYSREVKTISSSIPPSLLLQILIGESPSPLSASCYKVRILC